MSTQTSIENNISNIIIPYVRSAPFDPAPNNFRIDKLPEGREIETVMKIITNRLDRIGFDYTFNPRIAKWTLTKSCNDSTIDISMRLYRLKSKPIYVVDFLYRHGDKSMFSGLFNRIQRDKDIIIDENVDENSIFGWQHYGKRPLSPTSPPSYPPLPPLTL
tara:strand:- start:60 stop:542 length:483 start_codon:yes stop_codon:yes gene_type:complete